ncbi:NAD(+)/NADH kinase [Klebsiella pneumoniae subsp. pneumoniae]|nr:NAD(+)/NADH kinase [Klebsiella pneumoniae subsp. pneumoniae]
MNSAQQRENRHAGGDWPTGRPCAVVVGGDGNMLGAAARTRPITTNVIGTNRGNFGFLTDLDPDNALQQLARRAMRGHYIAEKRFRWRPRCVSRIARNVSAPPSTKWC